MDPQMDPVSLILGDPCHKRPSILINFFFDKPLNNRKGWFEVNSTFGSLEIAFLQTNVARNHDPLLLDIRSNLSLKLDENNAHVVRTNVD